MAGIYVGFYVYLCQIPRTGVYRTKNNRKKKVYAILGDCNGHNKGFQFALNGKLE